MNIFATLNKTISATNNVVIHAVDTVDIAVEGVHAEVAALTKERAMVLEAKGKVSEKILPITARASALAEAMSELVESGYSQEDAQELLKDL